MPLMRITRNTKGERGVEQLDTGERVLSAQERAKRHEAGERRDLEAARAAIKPSPAPEREQEVPEDPLVAVGKIVGLTPDEVRARLTDPETTAEDAEPTDSVPPKVSDAPPPPATRPQAKTTTPDKKPAGERFPCPLCPPGEFTAGSKAGLTAHTRAKHPEA